MRLNSGSPPKTIYNSSQPIKRNQGIMSNTSQPAVKETPSVSRVVVLITLFLSLLTVLTTTYLAYFVFFEQRDLFRSDTVGALEQLMEDSRRQQERLDNYEKALIELSEGQQALHNGIDNLSRDLGRDRTDWVLTEAEQLLIIANNRLQLAGDIDTAIAALAAADYQLKQLGSPTLLAVRKAITQEIASLKTLERPDIAGMALRLGGLSQNVDQLPLAIKHAPDRHTSTGSPVHEEQTESHGWFKEMWLDFTDLIRVRTDNQQHKALLSPKEEYFLRENLRLILFGAQNALLANNQKSYQNNLKIAGNWIKKYFDVNAASVKSLLGELDSMRRAQLQTEAPDISSSLNLLRKIRLGGSD